MPSAGLPECCRLPDCCRRPVCRSAAFGWFAGGMTDLEAALRAAVRGEVGFDVTSRALTTMDASNYRRVPLGVVAPRDADDVAATLAVCREHGVPVVPRGGGTSIAGQATGTGVVLDFTRHMNRLVSVDAEARTAVVQPGLVLDRLQEAAAPYGLRFGPDPSTHGRCTLGGMIGNNSCGTHSVAWGTTADSVRELDVVTARGRRLRLGRGGAGAPGGRGGLVGGGGGRPRRGGGGFWGRGGGRGCAGVSPSSPAVSPATRWTRCCRRRAPT